MNKLFFVALVLVFMSTQSVIAKPTPLGFSLGITTIKEVKEKYKILKSQKLTLSIDQYQYNDDLHKITLDGVKTVSFGFDKKGILQNIIILIDKNQEQIMLDILKSKYPLKISQPDCYFFTDNDVTITLSHVMQPNIIALNYSTQELYRLSNIDKRKSADKNHHLL